MKKLMASLILVIGFTSSASALIGPVYPAPGGNDRYYTGGSGYLGGETFYFSGFDSTEYSALFWGANENLPIGVSLDDDVITDKEIMTFDKFEGSVATWTGTTNLTWYGDKDGDQTFTWYQDPILTRLTVTLNGLNFIDAKDYGKSALGALAPVTGDFSANLLFEAYFEGLSGWYPIITGLGLLPGITGIPGAADFHGAFYHAAPVPIPGAALLLGSGLLGLAGLRRKFAA